MEETLFIKELFLRNRTCYNNFPDKELAERFVDDLFNLLFGSYEKKFRTEEDLKSCFSQIKNTFSAILFELLKEVEPTETNTNLFFASLPNIYNQLIKDAKATLEFDPAATSLEEVLIAYPGFYTTAVYRFAHQIHLQKVPILPRILSEYAHGKTGIDIHPGATIGESFTIDHGTGIVIGETATIGNQVKLYQGVTLGALNVDKAQASSKRHPTIQDNVVIYSGATILGGRTIIGNDSIIGGNVWLTSSVEPFSIVYHKSEVRVREKNNFPDVLNFVI